MTPLQLANLDRILITIALLLIAAGMTAILLVSAYPYEPDLRPAIYSDSERQALTCRVEMIQRPQLYKAWKHCE